MRCCCSLGFTGRQSLVFRMCIRECLWDKPLRGEGEGGTGLPEWSEQGAGKWALLYSLTQHHGEPWSWNCLCYPVGESKYLGLYILVGWLPAGSSLKPKELAARSMGQQHSNSGSTVLPWRGPEQWPSVFSTTTWCISYEHSKCCRFQHSNFTRGLFWQRFHKFTNPMQLFMYPYLLYSHLLLCLIC